MPLQEAIDSLSNVFQRHAWASELAGILPLSALFDFIEVPPKLHILELSGSIPLWSWVVTPSGSRLLLAKQPEFASCDCLQDRNTVALETLDGRYGDRYFAASPETLRLVLASLTRTEVVNSHENMAGANLRTQVLEVVHVSRQEANLAYTAPPRTSFREVFRRSWHAAEPLYVATTALGWLLLVGILIMSAFSCMWISFAFHLLVPVTGLILHARYGNRSRRLLVEKPSAYVRLLLVSEQMNSAEWIVIYGESSIVNSLLNRPLKAEGSSLSPVMMSVFRLLLCVCIIGQWALVLAAAATKNWNAYFISFWVSFSISSHSFLVTPTMGARAWAERHAKLKMERFSTRLSSRRALLNTIVALNPDTFLHDRMGATDWTQFNTQGMKWLDPILKPSESRTRWEQATQQAMKESYVELAASDLGLNLEKYEGKLNNFLSQDWHNTFRDDYWRDYIPEGIYIATKIIKAGNLPKVKTLDNHQQIIQSRAIP